MHMTHKHKEARMPKVTKDQLEQNFHLRRTMPERYLALAEEFVRADPGNPDGYWYRYHAFNSLGLHELALADLDKVISHEQLWILYELRGNALRLLGRYEEALVDYNKAEEADPGGWSGGFGRLFRADCNARLGHEDAALADCVNLPEEHWTPGLLGAPMGNKAEVIAEVRSLAAEARGKRSP
jgi:tetratricopeptide (TPR) repeat protein